jgi:menaquinone-9 beta-reductase
LGFEVFVVGGGPAGLAAAIALRLRGHAVALADCALPPIDKPCGEGLLPDSQAALSQLGVSLNASHGYSFRGIRFIAGERSAEGDFPGAPGFGIRRVVLQRLLINRARQLGVRMRWGVKGIGFRGGKLCVEGTPVHSGLVVAADGHHSPLRRAIGLDAALRSSRRYAYRRHYAMAPWSEYLELYWGDGFQIYVTPVSSQEICVALMSREPKLRLDDGLARLPEIARRLAGQPASSREMGAVTVWRSLRRITREGFALAGDAAGSVDPITGEGLRLAFQGATELASAVEAGDLQQYERAHVRMRKRTDEMAWLLTLLGDAPLLRQRVMAALGRSPGVFEGMLGVHVGAAKFFDFRLAQMLGFGWQLLAA